MYAITETKAITCKETIAEKRKKKSPFLNFIKSPKKKKKERKVTL